MNTKHLIISIVALLFVAPNYALALGEWYDPLHVQVSQDPLQQSLQESNQQRDLLYTTMNRSVVQHPNCIQTYNAIQRYKRQVGSMDVANPNTAKQARTYLEYLYSEHNSCVNAQQYTQAQQPQGQDGGGSYGVMPCPFGYVRNGTGKCAIDQVLLSTMNSQCQSKFGLHSEAVGWTMGFNVNKNCECTKGYTLDSLTNTCVSLNESPIERERRLDSACTRSFGSNSIWSGTINDDNTFTCTCSNGYEWSDDRTCVRVKDERAENDMICKNYYGTGSVWSGQLNEGGGPICDCAAGFEWNEQEQCQKVTPQAAHQICRNDFGQHSVWSGTYESDGRAICECERGYSWNGSRDSCIATVATENKELYAQNKNCRERYGNGSLSDGAGGCECGPSFAWEESTKSCVYLANKGAPDVDNVEVVEVAEEQPVDENTETTATKEDVDTTQNTAPDLVESQVAQVVTAAENSETDEQKQASFAERMIRSVFNAVMGWLF